LIEHGVTGLLCAPESGALAAAVLELADSPLLRERLARAALTSARARTWEQALERLGAGYRRVLASAGSAEVAHAA
jgi:glycosyltransferase involved in cell wall biosynthesis